MVVVAVVAKVGVAAMQAVTVAGQRQWWRGCSVLEYLR